MSEETKNDALAVLSKVLTNAQPASNVVPLVQQDGPPDDGAPPHDGGDADGGGKGGDAGPPKRKRDGLPEGCSVMALGKHGQRHFYLDALHQLIELGPRDHSRNHIAAIFAPNNHEPARFWPRKKEIKEKNDAGDVVSKWVTDGFKADAATDSLMKACAMCGVWDPRSRVRGLGAWEDEDGSLVMHCGDGLVTPAGDLPTGAIGRYVYPSEPSIPRPHDDPAGSIADEGVAVDLQDHLGTWRWDRPEVDPWLMMGWIGAAFIGGALTWRPMVTVTGDKSTGKSTLHRLIGHIFGDEILRTADCTAAGLTSAIGLGSIPVAIDELEADAENKRQQDVIRLMRIASSGDRKLRGSSDQKGSEFEVRSCFLISAILIPPLEPQDRSRLAILRLNPFKPGVVPPEIDAAFWRDAGRRIKRRMADQWPRLQKVLSAFELALARSGHDGRGCNQFGTLLACAHVLAFDDEPEQAQLDEWAARLDPKDLREIADTKSNAESCLDYLGQSTPEVYKGGSKRTVSALVEMAMRTTPAFEQQEVAKDALAAGGLAIVAPRKHGGRSFLAVPNEHRLVAALFEGSTWAGGGWAEALGRLEHARNNEVAKITGKACRVTLVPVDEIYTADPEKAAPWQEEDA